MKWPTVKLGTVARIRRGASPRPKGDPRYFGGSIPWLKIGDVAKGSRFVDSTEEGVTDDGRDLSVYVEPGTLLLSNSASVGRPVITRIGVCIHDGWLALSDYEEVLEREFLYWFFISAQKDLARIAPAGTQANLNTGLVNSFRAPIPAKQEQRRIVELLEQADELRRQRREADELADCILPALFHKMFGDPATNPKGWPRERLGLLLDGIDSGWSPVCENRQAQPDEWGVLKLGAVTTNRYLDRENKALQADEEPLPELEVKPGDFLVSRKNTRELLGVTGCVRRTRPKLMLMGLIRPLRSM